MTVFKLSIFILLRAAENQIDKYMENEIKTGWLKAPTLKIRIRYWGGGGFPKSLITRDLQTRYNRPPSEAQNGNPPGAFLAEPSPTPLHPLTSKTLSASTQTANHRRSLEPCQFEQTETIRESSDFLEGLSSLDLPDKPLNHQNSCGRDSCTPNVTARSDAEPAAGFSFEGFRGLRGVGLSAPQGLFS